MEYAMHERESTGGRLFDVDRGSMLLSQRVEWLSGDRPALEADELLYVLEGTAAATIDGSSYELGPGVAVFVSQGTAWSIDRAVRAVSVLVHDPPSSDVTHAVVDLGSAEKGAATAGRQFVLGATPEVGCESATQFIGLVPPGRAPNHFHPYDEVIYVLEGEGVLYIDSDEAPLEPGSCVHLPARLVHCLANTGTTELRLLGVFRPAGSPAEAYYPDGTLAAVPDKE
jgi:mannose-6-phosphate isomerase-like protein (cupin superfamily)